MSVQVPTSTSRQCQQPQHSTQSASYQKPTQQQQPDPSIQLPALPVHLASVCAFMDDSERGNNQLWSRIDQTFREFQAYLLHFIDSYARILMLQRCPVQTGLGVATASIHASDAKILSEEQNQQHHERALTELVSQLNRQLECLRQSVEIVQNVPSEARPLHDRIRSGVEQSRHSQVENETTEQRHNRHVPHERPTLPTLDRLREAAKPHTQNPTYGLRVEWIVRLFDTMLNEYQELTRQRRAVHRDINNFFLIHTKKICQVVVDAFDSKLVPHCHMRVQLRKKTEQTTLHQVFHQRTEQAYLEKTQFYTQVGVWIEAQVNTCLILLEMIWRLLPQSRRPKEPHGQTVSSQATSPHTLNDSRNSSVSVSASASASVFLDTPTIRHAEQGIPVVSIFDDLRSPLHSVVLTDAMYEQLELSAEQQHNYLKENVLIWHETFRIAHQTRHSHVALLPEMLQKLLKFVELVQRLFVRALQSTQWTGTCMDSSGKSTVTPTTTTTDKLLEFLTLEQLEKTSERDVAHRALKAIKQTYQACLDAQRVAKEEVDAHFAKPLHVTSPRAQEEEKRVRFAEPASIGSDTNQSSTSSTTSFSSKNLKRAEQLLRNISAPESVATDGTACNQENTTTTTTTTTAGETEVNMKLRPDDIERACRLETMLQQRRYESEQCRIKLEQVKRELRSTQVEASKYNEVVDFLNSFQQMVVPEWRRLIQRENELIHQWNSMEQSYHSGYVRFRYETAHSIDYDVFRTALDVREQVCVMFRDLLGRHLQWIQQLRELFVKSHRVIAQSRKTLQNLHAQITLSLESVSREITLFDNQLCHVMLQSDIYDIQMYEIQMKRVTLTFREFLIDMTTRAMDSDRLRNYLVQLDHMCCHENRLGFGFRILPSPFLDAHLPTSAIPSSTRLDRVVYELHQQTEPLSASVRTERDDIARHLIQTQQRLPSAHHRPTDL